MKPILIFSSFLILVSSLLAQPMNVLFIAADDLRNDLGCYGHPQVKTPNLDRLAQRGLVFNKAYCQQAVCNPSRASIMTGKRLDALRVWDLPTHFRTHAPDAVTLPQHFKKSGYFTQNIGKIFHNWIHEVQGDPASWSVPAVMHFANHASDKPEVVGELPPSSAKDVKCECRDVPDEAYFDGRVAKLAVEALEQRQAKAEPFFLAVGFWKPHSPFNAPKKYWDMYQREDIAMPKNPEWPQDAPRIAWHNSREILGEGKKARKVTDENIREMRHGYLANISYMDAQIGKVLDALDRLKLTDSTVIVFWSDHGYHLGEQTLFAKTSNFELDARVPMIIAMPQMKTAGQKTESLAELMDLYPTLAEVCALPKPTGTDGVSLAPVLADPAATVREAALTQHPRPAYYNSEPDKIPTHMGYTLRSATHRYTEWRAWKTGETTDRELYDHTTDPDETRNLASHTDQKDVLEKHAALLGKMNPVCKPGWKPLLPPVP
jgi:iduronate 2-sulfatase